MIPADELSQATLRDNVTGRGPQGYGDITRLVWPSYSRVTTAKGGDATASWDFAAEEGDLDYWLEEGLGQDLLESFEGEPVFRGRVEAVRVQDGPVAFLVALANVYNSVAVSYTSLVTNESQLTAYAQDQRSIDKWGERVLIYRPSEYMGGTEADELAADILLRSAWPRIVRGQVRSFSRDRVAQVKLEATGYAATLDGERYSEASDGSVAISTQIADLLATAGLVTAGYIESNSKLAEIQADPTPKLRRVAWLADQRDATGSDYMYGCFGSLAFDYRAVAQEVRYRVYTKRQPVEIYAANGGAYVPPALVRPGGYSVAVDSLAGVPISDARADFRTQYDLHVEYSQDGVNLRGPDWNINDQAQAIEMTVRGRR